MENVHTGQEALPSRDRCANGSWGQLSQRPFFRGRSFQQPRSQVCNSKLHATGCPLLPVHLDGVGAAFPSQWQERLLVGQAPSLRCPEPPEEETKPIFLHERLTVQMSQCTDLMLGQGPGGAQCPLSVLSDGASPAALPQEGPRGVLELGPDRTEGHFSL